MSELHQQHLVLFAVGGKELPVSLSSFQNLSVVENVSTKLPALEFTYSDPNNALIDNPLVDDTKIDIVLHSANYSDPEQPLLFQFRAKGAAYQPHGNRIFVRCAGIFDRMDFLRGIQKMPVEGPSSEGIKKIGSQTGFGKFDIDSTNDKMWWRPEGQMQFKSEFARHMAKHGRASDQSVMSMGVSDDGTLHYKDVAKLSKQSASRRITEVDRVNASNGDIPLIQWNVKSLGGVTNLYSGYGSKIVQEKLDGNADIIDKVAVPLLGGALNMDSGLSKAIGEVSNIYKPTNVGNHYDKFYHAAEQNQRGLAQLQSTIVECTTNQATGVKIYDIIEFRPHLPTTNTLFDLVVGPYIVTSKTRYFVGARYYREKFTLCRAGMGNLKTQVGYTP